jgi:hypothetical protein
MEMIWRLLRIPKQEEIELAPKDLAGKMTLQYPSDYNFWID